jgi:hypothetical protein
MGYRLFTAWLRRKDGKGSALHSGAYLLNASRVKSIAAGDEWDEMRYETNKGVGIYDARNLSGYSGLGDDIEVDNGFVHHIPCWDSKNRFQMLVVPNESIISARVAYARHTKGRLRYLYTTLSVDNGGRPKEYFVTSPLTEWQYVNEVDVVLNTPTISDFYVNGTLSLVDNVGGSIDVELPEGSDVTSIVCDTYIYDTIGYLALKVDGDYIPYKPGTVLDATNPIEISVGYHDGTEYLYLDYLLTVTVASGD